VWDSATGKEVLTFSLGLGPTGNGALTWSPDSRYLVGNDKSRGIVWDVSRGREVVTWNAPSNIYVWSPDGRRLAGLWSDGPIRIWDTTTWQELLPLRGTHADFLAFSPDGKQLATASAKGIKIWEVAGGRVLLALPGHGALAWSPDGK